MTLKKIIGLLCLLPLVAFAAKPTSTIDLEIPLTPKESISFYALKYGASEKELLKVAYCESRYNPKAIHYNDGGKSKHSFGVFQYQESTFNQFDNLIGEDLDYYSYNDQIKLTAYVFANYPKLKTHWSCFNILYK